MIPQAPDPRYVRAWRGYRWRLVACVLALAFWPASVVIEVPIRDALGGAWSERAGMALGFGWLALCVVTWTLLLMWRCPRCARPYFFLYGWRDPFARRCLHCGLAKWSLSPGPDEPVRDPRLPARPADLEAEVRFLTTEEGGRRSPLFTGYGGQLHYDDHDWDAIWGMSNRDVVEPGETVVAAVWLLSPEHHAGKLHPGKSFEVREGARVVARGVVTRRGALAGAGPRASGATA